MRKATGVLMIIYGVKTISIYTVALEFLGLMLYCKVSDGG